DREAELAVFDLFLDSIEAGPAAFVVEGEPGIGKSLLWRTCLETARAARAEVLSARPAESEAKMAFGALDDLLENVLDDALPALAEPKRRALEVALLRREPEESAPERRLISRAVLDALRLLSTEGSLVVAVDDVQWLDLPSMRVLEFVARRLDEQPIGIMLTRRVEGADERSPPLALDRALPHERLHVLRLDPLGLAAIHELVRSRLDARFPRHVLVRLYEQSGGNPFFALEIARVLITRGLHPGPEEDLPVPDDLRQILAERLAALPPAVREVLLFAAISSEPTIELVEAAHEGAARELLASAAEAGVIELDGEEIRFTHPLLRSVLRGSAEDDALTEVNTRLAGVVDIPEERARHLALAATGPDAAVASEVERAARTAAVRGAPTMAAVLLEEAHRLTPQEDEEVRTRRQVEAADYHFRAGDTSRARELLEELTRTIPAGADRAWVLYRLGAVRSQEESWADAERHLRAAMDEAEEDAVLRAQVHQQLIMTRLVAGDLPDAAVHGRASIALAEEAGDTRTLAYSQAAVASAEFLLGRGIDWKMLKRSEALEQELGEESSTPLPLTRPGVSRGIILKWSDDLPGARPILEESYRHAVETGDDSSIPFILYHLSELECWAGNWAAAARHAEEAHKVSLQSEQEGVRPAALYARALVGAHRGLIEAARADAQESLTLCERSANVPVMTLALQALGFIDVSLGDPEKAHARLGPMGEMLRVVGLGEPSVVKFLPDEVESLIALGELDQAKMLVDQFEERAGALDRVWALATGARCRAMLDAATGDME
ncbi:MAG TPA: AAA family ATPase, partial [Actinomycetota bacterium]